MLHLVLLRNTGRLWQAGVLTIALVALSGCAGNSGVATPVIAPAGGTYNYTPVLSITDSTAGTTLYYTTDGSNPTPSNSSVYTGSTFLKVSSGETVKVVASSGGKLSAVATATYQITLPAAPTPVLSLAPGAYLGAQSVTVTDAAPSASIYYTTDGTAPSSSSTAYTGPISVSASETLKVVAISQNYGYSYSAVAGGAYTILYGPTFSLTAGTYSSFQSLTLSDTTSGASIYYTTDGTTPTTSSTLYTGPIAVNGTETVSAIAAITAPGSSTALVTPVVSDTYIIHLPGTSFVLSGTAVSGQPVVGASVQLYEVGATGYSSAATPLLATPLMTDVTGAVTLTGQYTCAHGTYLYLTAAGGTAISGQTANPNLTLMTSLGLCDNLTSISSFTVNEQTTVAAAYALARFSSGTTFGTTQLSKPGSGTSSPADNFATSATNTAGLANAMAISQILTSNTTGGLGNNSNNSAVPEWWQLNLISDMLASCVRSKGGVAGDGSSCGTLFGNVVENGGAAPVDTLQAVLDLALSPTVASGHIANLYALASSTSPFQPYPQSAASIYDFSVAINYTPLSSTGKLLSQPQSIAIDSLGNAWVGNQPTGSSAPYPASLVELTPTGVPIQAGSTSGAYVINAYTQSGTTTTSSFSQYGSATNIFGLFAPSIDTNNNVWITDRQHSYVASITGSGATYSSSYSYNNGGNNSAVGYVLPTNTWPTSIYVDGSNNVWFSMVNGSAPPSNCVTGTSIAATGYTYGFGAFLGGSAGNVLVTSPSNALNSSLPAYITIDPNKNDTVSEAGGQEISGAPFLWVIGQNAGVNLILPIYDETAAPSITFNGGNGYIGCRPSAVGAIGQAASPVTVGALDGTSNSAHSQSYVNDIPNPGLSGDYFHDISVANDWTWDNAGNFWVANGGKNGSAISPIDTQTATPASEVLAAISKITPNWGVGTTFTSGGTTLYNPTASSISSFTFSVFHNQSGMNDGNTVTNVPEYITTDGSGNVYFTTNLNFYVNAFTGSGTALTQVSGTASSPVTGFVGSVCTSCSYNGSTATFQRPNTYTLSRPAIDESGNIWVPMQGSGSTSLYLLVGAASPRVQPDSVGLKNKTFANKP